MTGYCIPPWPTTLPHSNSQSTITSLIAIATHRQQPLRLLQLVQMQWRERFEVCIPSLTMLHDNIQIISSLATLLQYLQDADMNTIHTSIGIGDFRYQQFVVLP